jgi:hypothetical protein
MREPSRGVVWIAETTLDYDTAARRPDPLAAVFDAEVVSMPQAAPNLRVLAPANLISFAEDALRLFDAGSFELVGCTSPEHKTAALCFAGPGRVVAGLENRYTVKSPQRANFVGAAYNRNC